MFIRSGLRIKSFGGLYRLISIKPESVPGPLNLNSDASFSSAALSTTPVTSHPTKSTQTHPIHHRGSQGTARESTGWRAQTNSSACQQIIGGELFGILSGPSQRAGEMGRPSYQAPWTAHGPETEASALRVRGAGPRRLPIKPAPSLSTLSHSPGGKKNAAGERKRKSYHSPARKSRGRNPRCGRPASEPLPSPSPPG
jgi:hypothetical protein